MKKINLYLWFGLIFVTSCSSSSVLKSTNIKPDQSQRNIASTTSNSKIFTYDEICVKPTDEGTCISPSTMYAYNGLCHDLTSSFGGTWIGLLLESNQDYFWKLDGHNVPSGKDFIVHTALANFEVVAKKDNSILFEIRIDLQNPSLRSQFPQVEVDQQKNLCVLDIAKIQRVLSK
jgi:hypothetical protein